MKKFFVTTLVIVGYTIGAAILLDVVLGVTKVSVEGPMWGQAIHSAIWYLLGMGCFQLVLWFENWRKGKGG